VQQLAKSRFAQVAFLNSTNQQPRTMLQHARALQFTQEEVQGVLRRKGWSEGETQQLQKYGEWLGMTSIVQEALSRRLGKQGCVSAMSLW
jgi:hypothetical protein